MITSKQSQQGLARKLSNVFSRGVLKRSDGSKKTQALQVSLMDDESHDDIEYSEPYGLTTAPHEGAEVIAAFFGGNRDHGTVLKVFDKRYRVKNLANGEVCLYDDQGTKIHLKRGNKIEITAGVDITFTCPKVIITGNLEVQGDILDNSESNTRTVKGMREVYNAHTHGGGVPAPTGAEDM